MNREQKLQKTYFEIYMFSQVLCFTPIPKTLIFFLPFFAVLWFLKRNPLKSSFNKVGLAGFLFVLYPMLYYGFSLGDFFVVNYFVALLFYSSFFFFFIVKSPNNLDLDYFNRQYGPFIQRIIIVEAIIGILQVVLAGQGVDVSSGDYVQGTINLFSFLNNENGFNNVFFVINMTSLLVVYYLLVKQKRTLIFVLGCGSVILASTVHLSLAFIAAILATYLSLNALKAVKLLVPISLFFLILYLFFPTNFGSLSSYKEQIVESRNLKVKSTKTTLNALLSSPKDLFFGYGLGQYSSRSSLVSSGNYFYSKEKQTFMTPLGLSNESKVFSKNLKGDWIASITDEGYGFSVMNKPVYSILSIFSETGILISGLILSFFILFISRHSKRYKEESDKIRKRTHIAVLVLSFFIFTISLFENYLEMAQAIFSSLVLLKLFNTTH